MTLGGSLLTWGAAILFRLQGSTKLLNLQVSEIPPLAPISIYESFPIHNLVTRVTFDPISISLSLWRLWDQHGNVVYAGEEGALNSRGRKSLPCLFSWRVGLGYPGGDQTPQGFQQLTFDTLGSFVPLGSGSR